MSDAAIFNVISITTHTVAMIRSTISQMSKGIHAVCICFLNGDVMLMDLLKVLSIIYIGRLNERESESLNALKSKRRRISPKLQRSEGTSRLEQV